MRQRSHTQQDHACPGNHVCSNVGTPVRRQPTVREKMKMVNRTPCGFLNENSLSPSWKQRSFSLATRLRHQAQSQSLAVSPRLGRGRGWVSGFPISTAAASAPLTAWTNEVIGNILPEYPNK